ncbi:MAG: hypothetical protein JWM68_1242 [Verrucomicrobiales bacterium]|nr:hypothetical protein [Verrucomicrobiales bacterium]
MTKLLLVISGIFAITTFCSAAELIPAPTNSTPRNLLIASSSTPVTGGKVTLNIDKLCFKKDCYIGGYHIKVSPYFFRNENGNLSMDAPDASLRKLTNGLAVAFTGKATSSNGKVKKINGTITPTGQNQGTVSLWFMSGDTKMTFNTTYRCSRD